MLPGAMDNSPQLREWRGDFGDRYIERNLRDPRACAGLVRGFSAIFNVFPEEPRSILEVGANVGRNIEALSRVTVADLWALEPNVTAREALRGLLSEDRILDGHAGAIPLADRSADLEFTAAVLIHVPPEELDDALREIHRVAERWVLSIEYFAPNETTVSYRGRDDLLWKRDYGSLLMDAFPDLELVSYGFLWRRATPFDDTNWWLFRKAPSPSVSQALPP
jgi:spore coat polysaccharide biosynthesis protein SpsF